MVQFASYLRQVLCKTRLIFPRINGPNIIMQQLKLLYAIPLKYCDRARERSPLTMVRT